MSDKINDLERELVSSGADPSEAKELSELALRLPAMRQLPLMQAPESLRMGHRSAKRRMFARQFSRMTRFASSLVAAAAVAVVVIVSSQMAVPGDSLYSVKRASEVVAVALNPGFHDEIMMRRADEVDQLVDRGSNPSLVSATLESYDQAVDRDPASSYAARDYCAKMLETAAAHASQSTRAQIEHSLSLLKLDNS